MSSKFDETVNQFNIGDCVKVKGKTQEMTITSHVSGGSSTDIEHYLNTDKFVCKWIDVDGNNKIGTFSGIDLECC